MFSTSAQSLSFCMHILHVEYVPYLLACVASVSAQVRREKLEQEQKKE